MRCLLLPGDSWTDHTLYRLPLIPTSRSDESSGTPNAPPSRQLIGLLCLCDDREAAQMAWQGLLKTWGISACRRLCRQKGWWCSQSLHNLHVKRCSRCDISAEALSNIQGRGQSTSSQDANVRRFDVQSFKVSAWASRLFDLSLWKSLSKC